MSDEANENKGLNRRELLRGSGHRGVGHLGPLTAAESFGSVSRSLRWTRGTKRLPVCGMGGRHGRSQGRQSGGVRGDEQAHNRGGSVSRDS